MVVGLSAGDIAFFHLIHVRIAQITLNGCIVEQLQPQAPSNQGPRIDSEQLVVLVLDKGFQTPAVVF